MLERLSPANRERADVSSCCSTTSTAARPRSAGRPGLRLGHPGRRRRARPEAARLPRPARTALLGVGRPTGPEREGGQQARRTRAKADRRTRPAADRPDRGPPAPPARRRGRATDIRTPPMPTRRPVADAGTADAGRPAWRRATTASWAALLGGILGRLTPPGENMARGGAGSYRAAPRFAIVPSGPARDLDRTDPAASPAACAGWPGSSRAPGRPGCRPPSGRPRAR